MFEGLERFYQGLMNKMATEVKVWIKERIGELGELPALPNKERGLEIGFGLFGRLCRKVIMPDGTLVILDFDYNLYRLANDEEYLSKTTLIQLELTINKAKQQKVKV